MAEDPHPPAQPQDEQAVHVKDQVLGLYLTGIREIEDLAMLTASRPSYVGSVLQEAGFRPDYFDLYTSTAHPMNVYSKFFAGKLGFKDVETARESVSHIDRLSGSSPSRGTGPVSTTRCSWR